MALAALAALSLASLPMTAPSPASANGYHYGFENDDKESRDDFGWALVHDGNNSSSSLERENIDAIRGKYGDDILYIRDGEERYVIRDEGLMHRAEESLKPIEDAGREIGVAVGAKVRYSLGRSQGSREQARVERRIARLSRRIERMSEEGEDVRDLEIERGVLEGQLESMREDRSFSHDDGDREADLEAATQRATRHMHEATRKLRQDLRSILRDAKARHLAESVQD
jgi:hypothetical protein